MDQREVWDNVGEDWHKFRQHPVSEAMDFLKNKRGLVLDLACGSGRNFMDVEGKIIGTDFSERMLRSAKKNAASKNLDIDLVNADALTLPFKNDIFDAVLFCSAFQSIKWNRRNEALREISRVSKKGAELFISVWNRDQPRFAKAKRESFVPWKSKSRTYQRYYYLYSKEELEALLKKFFKNVKVFGSADKAFGKYSKNIVATGRARK